MIDFEKVQTNVFDPRFKVFFVDHFENPNYTDHILDEMPEFEKWKKKKISMGSLDLRKIPTMLHAYYKYPILSVQQEHHLFRQMHYYRHQSLKEAKLFEATGNIDNKDACVHFYKKQLEVRDLIVACNVRLTTIVIKKRKDLYGSDLSILLSDGFLNLIKATEAFDYRKGIRFSTYSTWVLLNNSVREQTPNLKNKEFFAEYDNREGKCEDKKYQHSVERKESTESAVGDWQKIKSVFGLSMSKELQVIQRCFGIDCEKEDVEQIAKDMGLSRERIRQLRKKGIKEIKKNFDCGLLDIVGI